MNSIIFMLFEILYVCVIKHELYVISNLHVLVHVLVMAVIFQAAVWLRLAECLNSLGEVERAVNAYSRVVEMAPSHIEARMSLSTLQSQLGKHEEALKALSRGK